MKHFLFQAAATNSHWLKQYRGFTGSRNWEEWSRLRDSNRIVGYTCTHTHTHTHPKAPLNTMLAFDPDKRENVFFFSFLSMLIPGKEWLVCFDHKSWSPQIFEAKAIDCYNAGYMLPHAQCRGVLWLTSTPELNGWSGKRKRWRQIPLLETVERDAVQTKQMFVTWAREVT